MRMHGTCFSYEILQPGKSLGTKLCQCISVDKVIIMDNFSCHSWSDSL